MPEVGATRTSYLFLASCRSLIIRYLLIRQIVEIKWKKGKGTRMNYFIDGLKNYAVVTGRETRKQYWMFVQFSMLAYII